MNAVARPQLNYWLLTALVSLGTSIIAALLLILGGWLAAVEVPSEPILNYSYSEVRVGNISAWHVSFTNQSDFAYSIKFAPPSDEILQAQFEPAGNPQAYTWTGKLLKGQTAQVLYILKSPSARLSNDTVQSQVTAVFEDRNAGTGDLELRKAILQETGTLSSIPRLLLVAFWYVLPIFVVGAGILIWMIYSRSRAKGKAAPSN
jgi:hypothetical protein